MKKVEHDGGFARVGGFFAMMLGIGLILDGDALGVGVGVVLGAGAVFAWGAWRGWRAERGSDGRRRHGVLR